MSIAENENPKIVIVVARAENGVIGYDGQLPWKLSSDLKFFRAQTMGKPIIMGRKTFESIGKPLPGRDNIIVTRNPDYRSGGTIIAASLQEAHWIACGKARERGVKEIAVIGGADIYRQALPQCDAIILTEVHSIPEGDVFFPKLNESEWIEVSRKQHKAGEKDSSDYSFVRLERVQSRVLQPRY